MSVYGYVEKIIVELSDGLDLSDLMKNIYCEYR